MGGAFFSDVTEPIRFEGLGSSNPLAYKVYDKDRQVLGRRMAEHLRIGVCLWHSFAWPGTDMFGAGTMDRPWLAIGEDPMDAARTKMAVAFEFLQDLDVPYYCFHDRDVAPDGKSFAEFRSNLDALADDALGYQERTGTQLLWGTANLFTHPRYAGGAATNPDPEVFAYAAAQVKNVLEITLRLGGENYVLWGGREGYDTLLNTDLKREGDQLARFLHLVADHKHKIGFTGALLIEPKPMEPTKHQYDYDSATIHGFLVRNGLEGEYQLNIEANHATLAGHSFHHEVAYAVAHGIMGSIDANRGDPQNGWDTDQFPNSVEDLALPLYEILKGGGFTSGGFNFDAKLRRQSIDRNDLLLAHIGGIDTLARALLVAADLLEQRTLSSLVEQRYAGWSEGLGARIIAGDETLETLEAKVAAGEIDPAPVSGSQEQLENLVNQRIWAVDR
ncbi:MAG TPA: xylose isomerase [Candidatus Saccharimonadales bacterium]|nr:xylose isomerase [Candidatus Saccharimonadales bacterium]